MGSQEKLNDKDKKEIKRTFLPADEIARLFLGLTSVLTFILVIVFIHSLRYR